MLLSTQRCRAREQTKVLVLVGADKITPSAAFTMAVHLPYERSLGDPGTSYISKG